MSPDSTASNDCGCCEPLDAPASHDNPPGLEALRYRLDTHSGFFARMLYTLALRPREPKAPDSPRPLAGLRTREADDPTIALLDASACVLDVLTFYQERIANEGYLRTATERGSVLELARAIGYELKPGVAASVHLAFTVEDSPGAPGVCTVAQGTAVQSIPPQGKLPQVFETSAEIIARAEWNALRPRQVRPADMALLDLPATTDAAGRTVLVLLGPAGSFPEGTQGLHAGKSSLDLFRLDPDIPVDPIVDALEVSRVYFTEAAGGVNGGDLLLFVGNKGEARETLVLRALEVVAEPDLKRIRVDLEALPDPETSALPPLALWAVPYAIQPILNFAQPQVSSVAFTHSTINASISSQAWRERDLQAMIGIQGWSGANLVKAIAAPGAGAARPEAGAFAFAAKLGFFGHNAPKWKLLPPDTASTHGNAYPEGWDPGDDVAGGALGAQRSVWEDSQGNAIAPRVYLERWAPNVTRMSWAVFDAPDLAARVYMVLDAREVSRADFGVSGRAMQVRLMDANGEALPSPPGAADSFRFRTSTAHVASRRMALADLPIDAPLAAGETRIELERMVLGLSVGQPIALTGERADLPGVAAAEIAVLAEIVHADGRTTLMLQHGLVHAYARHSMRINANVVHATHGESVSEVLGNGDASVAHQRFTLQRSPVTHLSAPGGAASTLEVRIAGVRWDEVPSLYGAAPDEPVYQTRIDDDATMHVTFGDGVQGARLPSGTLNVAARYRSGIGPDGEVDANTLTMLRALPLGLRGVTNPLAAAGAEGPEQLAAARRNAPLTLLTFERVVSLTDYENFARAFPGIGKARGDVLWIDGMAQVFLTVAGATGGAPGTDVLQNLSTSIVEASDGTQRFGIRAFAQRYFTCKARIGVDSRYLAAEVLGSVANTLLTGFGFEARDLGQSVTAAEVVAMIHTVAGVVAVDLEELLPYGQEAAAVDASAVAVPAFRARIDAATRTVLPAELLLISPAGPVLEEMAL